MSLEKLEKLLQIVNRDFNDTKCRGHYLVNTHPEYSFEFKNLMTMAAKILPDHAELFVQTYEQIDREHHPLDFPQARSILWHMLQVISLEKSSAAKGDEMKIFENAEVKMKQANL